VHINLYNYEEFYANKGIAGIDGVCDLINKIAKAPVNLSID
jgi:hypothetical protein